MTLIKNTILVNDCVTHLIQEEVFFSDANPIHDRIMNRILTPLHIFYPHYW